MPIPRYGPQAELDEFRSEASTLKNQEVTVRRLEERNRTLEHQLEHRAHALVDSKVSAACSLVCGLHDVHASEKRRSGLVKATGRRSFTATEKLRIVTQA